MRLIDRDKLVQEIENDKAEFVGTHEESGLLDVMCDYALDFIMSAPVVDAVPVVRCVGAVPVVRCKECKHRVEDEFHPGQWICEMDSADPYERNRDCENDDWFCADGERRDGEQDGKARDD